ncbi:immunoglobulin-like domain-containing protein [Candidatus Endoriftia persephonae]|jgi:hypothetical protein|uniref:DUF5011 domain-containing protein n=1 Tax=Candidatus Endoriftia persephonae TaxID=393765 RepID=A0A9J7A1H9_9GAMM|nr:immunoglobulin-like domain-containing protein [Candidatus Endoriftia persephone]USF88974.1 DUF5011 domain-containing protein [Candidatus Endoriftia persephone]
MFYPNQRVLLLGVAVSGLLSGCGGGGGTTPDTTPPTISRSGDATVILEAGPTATYTDAGATATDDTDGNITANITVNNPVDPTTPGTYTVTYNVTDAASNAATQVTRTVTVVAAAAPTITLAGDSVITLEASATPFTEPGVSADDSFDGDISASVNISGSVDTSTVGSYTLTYSVTDAAGNAATQVTRTINVTADLTPPIISVNAPNPHTWETGPTVYIDPGVTAIDALDGDITPVLISGTVDTNTPGSYTLTYNVSDSSGNPATPVTRTVNVIAATPPSITLLGDATVTREAGSVAYTDAGATASDNIDGDITANILINNPVDATTAGSYTVTYDVTDTSGNAAAQVTRTVTIQAAAAPVITLSGEASVTLEAGPTPYSDPGATANDNIDGDLTASIQTSGSVDATTPGTYTLTYDVTDAAGNAATQVTRTVTVLASTPPTITLTGDNPQTIEGSAAATYTDPGFSANDNVDGDISARVVTSGSVDPTAVGTYTLTYNVSDTAGNAATAVTRTVNVVDTTAPVISLRGDDPVYVAVGENYTEPGAEGVDAMDGAGFDTALDATDPKDITKTNDVDTNVMGQYTRVYTATDAAGNVATLTRTVIVGPAVTMTADNKQLHFDWPLPANTTLYANHDHYRLLFDRDGSGTFSTADAASSSIAGTSHSVDTSAHLFNWNDARYRVESCDAAESDCLGSPLGRFRGENELFNAGYSVDIISYFKASDTTTGAQFGNSAAVSSDGTTMAVGAPDQDSGIVYIFVRDTSVTPPVWSQQGRVSAGGTGDKFGFSVALSSDGSTLAVGAQLEDSSVGGIDPTANDSAADAGAAYVFTRTGSSWSQQAYIKAATPSAGDQFGIAVSLSDDGNTLAVGAGQEDGSASNSGAAYLFTRSGTTWSQQTKLKAGTPTANDGFGFSVAVSGDGSTLAVGAGAPVDATGAEVTNSTGKAYIFTQASGWAQQAELLSDNADARDHFGHAVALSDNGNTLAVSAIGEGSNSTGINSTPTNEFDRAGAAYIFTRSGTTWTQSTYIKPDNPDAVAYFGQSVSLSGDGAILAVGADHEDGKYAGVGRLEDTGGPDTGAVYIFTNSAGAWSQTNYVKASNPGPRDPVDDPAPDDTIGDHFGYSVALSGDGNTLVVGAKDEDSGTTGVDSTPDETATTSGAAYVY